MSSWFMCDFVCLGAIKKSLPRVVWSSQTNERCNKHFKRKSKISYRKSTLIDWIVTPKRYAHVLTPGTYDQDLFGNRIFVDLIKLKISRWNHSGYRVYFKSTDEHTYKTEKKPQKHKKDGPVKTSAETGVLLPQAKEHQGLTAATRS